MTTKHTIIAALLSAIAASAITAAFLSHDAPPAHEHAHDAPKSDAAATQYTCPMHPSVMSDRPGVCPICNMDLVPKKTGAHDALDSQQLAAAGRVSLSPAQRVLANVQTAEATGGALERELRAVGVATYDETGLAAVTSWVAGRIERLYIKETGKKIARGQRLMSIYSPTLYTAQEELLALTKSPEPNSPLIAPARRRLELLGMSAAQIDEVIKRAKPSAQVTIFAPSAGTITAVTARQGQYVEVGAPLMELADLGDVWIEAQIYERARALVREGMAARVVADAYPNESFTGRVTLIQPAINAEARTTPVRVELDGDAARRFKPGMYATVYIDLKRDAAPSADASVVIPLDAIIRTGRRDYVYVEVEENLFERREVQVTAVTDGQAQLTSGVEPGERVAATGGFLIDSELQLRAPTPAHAPSHSDHAHDHTHDQASHVTLPPEGKRFDPPIKPEQVPPGAWYCDMGTVEYARPDQGDGVCPVCNMKLKQRVAEEDKKP